MFYGNSVQDTRQLFFSSWKKHLKKEPLLPLEKQIIDVILIHPEYHALLEGSASERDKAYFPELGQTNPFLHMGLHLAIRDQVVTNRPAGIADVFHALVKQYHDNAAVEHMFMDHFAEYLWQAQRNGRLPDEASYLYACQQLIFRPKVS